MRFFKDIFKGKSNEELDVYWENKNTLQEQDADNRYCQTMGMSLWEYNELRREQEGLSTRRKPQSKPVPVHKKKETVTINGEEMDFETYIKEFNKGLISMAKTEEERRQIEWMLEAGIL